MWRTVRKRALASVMVVALAGGAMSDEGAHAGAGHEHQAGAASAPEAWAALRAARNAIAEDLEQARLGEIHGKAESLPALGAALVAASGELDAAKRARVEGAAKQLARVADALHRAADRGDAERTRKELSRLDDLLRLMRSQYPPEALGAGSESHAEHGSHGRHHEHMHGQAPAARVEEAPRATLEVEAFDALRFEPRRLEIQAGVPTRIVLVNRGAAEHALVVKAPDGERDWIHLHAAPGARDAATFRIDQPGSYPVACTIPGHAEGGMKGELVVVAGEHANRPQAAAAAPEPHEH